MALTACGTTGSTRSGVFTENFDRSVRPQDDFYRFVNGAWLKRTTIPDDQSNFGVFTLLADNARKDARTIIQDAAAGENAAGSEAEKIGNLYASYLDTKTLDALGTQPLQPLLARVEAMTTKADVVERVATLRRDGYVGPVVLFVGVDSKNPQRYAVHLTQSGLGLPDRDYYVVDNERFAKLRTQYVAHISHMLQLSGVVTSKEGANQQAAQIMKLETSLAEGQWTRTQRRDRDKTYNKRTVAQLETEAPGIGWRAFFDASGLKSTEAVVVRELSYMPKFAEVLAAYSVDDWKAYLRWLLVREGAELLTPALDRANFAFFGTALQGTPQQKLRWERAVQTVNSVLGEAVGQLYVAKHFKPAAKARMVKLVENLREAYRRSIQQLEWMGEETKKEALDKLAKFVPKIGYPDRWKDYSKLVIKRDDLFGNAVRASQAEYDRKLAQLGGPVDRGEWFMTPQTVNAYYNPSMNEIVFPAAILQPPFFDLEADDAVNYGAIGAVIGHEMGHGFDDQGAKSDGDGLLRNWWTDSDLKEFKARTQKLVDQYGAYVAIGDSTLNGEFTLGENIGDLGGINIAHRAYLIALDGEEAPEMDGFTGDQRFFIGWAQCWPRLYRDEELRRRLVVDPHSPSEFRANGAPRNMDAFVKAFAVKPGDTLWLEPSDRVRIW